MLGAGADFTHPWQRLGEWLRRVVDACLACVGHAGHAILSTAEVGVGGMVAQAYNSSTQGKRQKNQKFKVSLSYIKRSRPVCSTQKKKKREEKQYFCLLNAWREQKQGDLVDNTVHCPN